MKDTMNSSDSPFLPHGGYRKLRSYKVAEAVYDATVVFCRRFYAQDRRMSEECCQVMLLRTARKGPRTGQAFWGCSAFPDCKGTLAVSQSDKYDQSERSDKSPEQ